MLSVSAAARGRRLFSTAPSQRLVVSRRAWNVYTSSLPNGGVKPRIKKTAADDKPWPKSVQIGGAVAAGVLIPYSIVWFLTSSPDLRESSEGMQSFLDHPLIRGHFGEPEWDGISYTDAMTSRTYEPHVYNEGKHAAPPLKEAPYQYPSEPTYQQRRQQEIIEQLKATDIPTRLTIMDSNGERTQPTKSIPGSTLANIKSIMEQFQLSASAAGASIGVEFDDEFEESGGETMDSSLMNDTTSFSTGDGSDMEPSENEPILSLLKRTGIFSTWYYQAGAGQQEAASTSSMSDDEREQSRLEYTISKLQSDLKDPTCTRNMDDMAEELQTAKKDLRRLKWKRRLGF